MTLQGTVEPFEREDMDIARLAAETLAGELTINVNEIEVDTVRAVEWRDTSIGCPQPGMSYTQALVPGVRVILEHGGELYHYHGTAADNLSYCENPRDPVAGDPGDA